MQAYRNNKLLFTCTGGTRVVADTEGKVQQLVGIDSVARNITLVTGGRTYKATVRPNEVYLLSGGKLQLQHKVPFTYKP